MIFSPDMINSLRQTVRNRLSEKRYRHTLGVEAAALKIADACGCKDTSEISAAALLHDISKEYSEAEHKELIKRSGGELSSSDMLAPQVLHSVTAPIVIRNEFSQFASSAVLSAVLKHTVADTDMSLCDKIIFVADYIEDGRTYIQCVQLRERLYTSFDMATSYRECVSALDLAVLEALSNTISSLREKGQHVHEKSVAAYTALSDSTGLKL